MNHDRYTQIELGNHCTVILEIVNGKIEVVDAMRKGDVTIPAKENHGENFRQGNASGRGETMRIETVEWWKDMFFLAGVMFLITNISALILYGLKGEDGANISNLREMIEMTVVILLIHSHLKIRFLERVNKPKK